MGSAAKKQRRMDNQILSQFYIDSQAGRARLKDVHEVKDILIRLGEPFSEVITDRELFPQEHYTFGSLNPGEKAKEI